MSTFGLTQLGSVDGGAWQSVASDGSGASRCARAQWLRGCVGGGGEGGRAVGVCRSVVLVMTRGGRVACGHCEPCVQGVSDGVAAVRAAVPVCYGPMRGLAASSAVAA